MMQSLHLHKSCQADAFQGEKEEEKEVQRPRRGDRIKVQTTSRVIAI